MALNIFNRLLWLCLQVNLRRATRGQSLNHQVRVKVKEINGLHSFPCSFFSLSLVNLSCSSSSGKLFHLKCLCFYLSSLLVCFFFTKHLFSRNSGQDRSLGRHASPLHTIIERITTTSQSE